MKKRIIFLMCIFALVTSCSKDDHLIKNGNDEIVKSQLTPGEQILRKNMKSTALLVTQIASNREVQQEVYNSVKMRYEGKDRILFKQLLDPEIIKSAKSCNFETGFFKEQFLKIASQSSLKGASEDSFNVIDFVMKNNIEIAWHYTQEWNANEIPAISFNPINNDSINVGYKVYYDQENKLTVDTIIINDDYAFSHPVWIIDQHNYLPAEDPNSETFLGEQNDSKGSNSAKSMPDGNAKYNKVFIYQVRTYKDNFRGLFGGENEMYFRRAGSEVVLGTEKTYSTLVTIDRWAGRKEVWRTVNAVWDENWQPEEVTQWLGVEAINVVKDRTTKYSGDVSLKLELSAGTGAGAKPEIKPSLTIKLFGWEVTVTWKNQIWYNNTKSREQFFIDNWRDAARQGIKDGRSIYFAGKTSRRDGVYFTMDVDAYNY